MAAEKSLGINPRRNQQRDGRLALGSDAEGVSCLKFEVENLNGKGEPLENPSPLAFKRCVYK